MGRHSCGCSMAGRLLLPLAVAAAVLWSPMDAAFCDRTPGGSTAPPTKLTGDRFKLAISGNPDKYVPGERYTVSLQGSRQQHQPYRFTGFTLVVEPTDEMQPLGDDLRPLPPTTRVRHHGRGAGTFSLYGDALTKFSERCPNTVIQTSTYPKAEIQVLWTAPPSGSGCVTFRATVIEQPDVWYMDDGPLSYTFCEELEKNFDIQPHVQKECCACEEAKYELTFEGLWSRHTHPKGFPDDSFLAKFSDVIGASHTSNYYFWSYGGKASLGLQQVAERGSTRELERELKLKSQEIRTIIKARGISFPNVTGKTFAVFRVDRKHHLMSIVSMIDPSPDWIVGVAGLELCLQNCSWAEYLELNLYPWDVGTDSGITYTSPNMPTVPKDVIRRITSSFPNNESSPFFDKSGTPMKPLARLYLTRQRLYEKSCSDDDFPESTENPENSQEECKTTQWSEWSPCTVTCGNGHMLRQRFYVDEARAEASGCKQRLTSRKSCTGTHRTCKTWPQEWECEVTEWSEWSECSNNCGEGRQIRTRQYKHQENQKKCRVLKAAPKLQETVRCFSKAAPDCEATSEDEKEFYENHEEVPDPNCPKTQWSEWSACSATCGNGTKLRTRLRVFKDGETQLKVASLNDRYPDDRPDCSSTDLVEHIPCSAPEQSCEVSEEKAREYCSQERDSGPCRGYHVRWFFDGETCMEFRYGGCRGNKNKFETKEECERICMSNIEQDGNEITEHPRHGLEVGSFILDPSQTYGLTSFPSISDSISAAVTAMDTEVPVDCEVSEWSDWTPCSVTCGRGVMKRERHIQVSPRNGGKKCPSKLSRTKKCQMRRCEISEVDDNPTWGESYTSVSVSDADCILSHWSRWSHCSATCGQAFKQRTRSILRPRRSGGAPCGSRLEKEKCELPICKD